MPTTPFAARTPSPPTRLWRWSLGALVCVASLAGAFAVAGPAVVHIDATPDALVVHHGIVLFRSDTVVPRDEVTEVVALTTTGAFTRTNGTARPGFCEGRFRHDELGAVMMAGNCSDDVVVVRRAGDRPLVLTPPDPAAFVAAWHAGAPLSVDVDTRPEASWSFFLIAAIAVAGPALLASLFFVVPLRIGYAVGDGQLVVSTALSRHVVPLAGATARIASPTITLRAFGTALPGYLTGWFRAEGRMVRIFATDRANGVWIEPAGAAPVWVTPEDPAAFLAALAHQGAVVG